MRWCGPVSMPARSLVRSPTVSFGRPKGILPRPLLLRAPSHPPPRTSFDARIPTRVSALLMTSPGRVHRPLARGSRWASAGQPPRVLRKALEAARDFHVSRFGPSSGDLSLTTVCSASGLAGLLHPAAMSRTTTVQGPSLSADGRSLVDSAEPPCRSIRARSPVARLPRSRTSTSRPCSLRSRVARVRR
jgi:hypothetical protein